MVLFPNCHRDIRLHSASKKRPIHSLFSLDEYWGAWTVDKKRSTNSKAVYPWCKRGKREDELDKQSQSQSFDAAAAASLQPRQSTFVQVRTNGAARSRVPCREFAHPSRRCTLSAIVAAPIDRDRVGDQQSLVRTKTLDRRCWICCRFKPPPAWNDREAHLVEISSRVRPEAN